MASLEMKAFIWLERLFVWPVMLYRYCKFGYTFRRIYLGEGFWTILDEEDYYRLRHFKWVLYGGGHNWYAARLKVTGPYKTRTISMHREIMNAPKGKLVDHRNCESLDNRRSNLRFATRAENVRNRRKQKNTTSQFIGVSFYKPTNNWESRIQHGDKRIRLGRFDSEIDAAKAYDEAAKRLFGEFARLNFPPENEQSRALFARIGKLIRPKTPDLRRKTVDSV
jgi:hypothetical protein